jgi:hypothetical protein
LKKAIFEHTEQGDMEKADEALKRFERTLPESIDLETYTAVLNGWVQHLKQVEDGPQRVHQQFRAADRANAILERLQRKFKASEDAVLRPTQQHYDAVLNAWLLVTRSMLELDTPLRGIPQRAQRVLEELQRQAKSDSSVYPTIQDYNAVIETWGNSPEHLRGSMAESVFQQVLEPNNDSYLAVIRAWCRSKQDRAAFTATGHLMKVHRIMGKDEGDFGLALKDYKTILEAWTRAGDKLAPQKAFWVIKLMNKAYMDRVSDVRPDEECYRYVLGVYAKSKLPNLGQDVDELMTQMEDRLLSPDTDCFTFAIRAWKNCATNYSNEGTQHEDATHAAKLLTKMEKAQQVSSSVVVQPTTENFNDVMQAWSTSTKAGAAIHAESLLNKLEQAYANGDENLKPDANSYRWVLEAWAKSPSRDKLNHAVTVLARMKDLTEGSQDDHAKPTVDVFNAFIRVCGATDNRSLTERKFNLKLAVNTVDEMRKRGEAPNSATFHRLLEACENLLPMGRERCRAVESIFKNCCYLGLVDDEVLAQVKSASSEELFTDMVVAKTTEEAIEGTLRSSKMVPESWTRNIGVKVETVDGKQPKPLNIDAMFVVTRRVKEFRTRNLRQHKNKRLLRSGRALYVKNSRMASSP